MQGREIDMDALMARNELMPAVGNVRMNARGDELGPGGKVLRKREDVVAEYYEDNPNAAPKEKVITTTQSATKAVSPQKHSSSEKTEVKKSV